jgi:hypothetical protein
MNFVYLTYKTSVGASHLIQPISIIKGIGLVIIRKIMAMLSEKEAKKICVGRMYIF